MKPGEPLPVGHMLDGRYRIHKVLGQGGMGRVYLANDTRLANRPVACKEMIIGDGLHEKKAIEDFNREARVLASLSHPSIPQVIDYFAEQGRHYLVMEFVAGGDLQHHLDAVGAGARMPEPKVLRWALQILDVLVFLHEQSPPIVYRDLKPGNIMIDQNGRAMLVDFGIARFLPQGGRGTQIGSVGYAPPEQYLGKLEPRSDLYSLAATMHHLLTGRDPQLEPPFSFPPVRALVPAVSMQTERVVMSALDKDVNKRPRSAREMRDALPNPSADEASASGLPSVASGSRNPAAGAGLGAMATIVLNRPIAPSPGSQSTPPPRAPVRQHRQQPPAASSPNPAARSIAHQKTQRSLPFPPPGASAKAVSSSARTEDLGLKSKAPPARAKSVSANGAGPPSPSASRARSVAVTRVAAAISSAAKLASAIGAKASGAAGSASPATHETPRPVASTKEGAPTGADNGFVAPASRKEPYRAVANRMSAKDATVVMGRDPSPKDRTPPVAAAYLVAAADGAQFGLFGGRMIIGRPATPEDSVDIDLSLLKRGIDRVSRRHAEIMSRGGEYFIRDLGSLNGTYITGRGRLGRDQLYKLKDRDEIVLGGAKLEFRKG